MPELVLEGAAPLSLAPWPCTPATSLSGDSLVPSRSGQLLVHLETHPAKEKQYKISFQANVAASDTKDVRRNT